MALNFNSSLPKELTNSAWQKQKSLADKVSTKTNIGAILTKLEAEWKKLDFTTLDPDEYTKKNRNPDALTPGPLTEARDRAEKIAGGQLKQVYNLLTGVGYAAKQATALKDLSKDAKTAAADVSAAAYALAKEVNNYSAASCYDPVIKKAQDQIDDVKNNYAKGVQMVEKLIRVLSASPNQKTWDLVSKELPKNFGLMQTATSSLSRIGGGDKQVWTNASSAIRALEGGDGIPKVIQGLKDAAKDASKQDELTKKAFYDFVNVANQQLPVLKRASA